MGTVPLVDELKDDGQLFLDRLADDRVDVRAACWLKRTARDRWSLYIATRLMDDRGAIEAYRVVLASYRALGELYVRDDDITLITTHHPLVHDLQNNYLIRSLRVLDGSEPVMLGGIPVEGVYVYPSRNPFKIYFLEFKGDPSRVRSLAFEQQNPNALLTIGDICYSAEAGVDSIVSAPDGSVLERDELGRLVLRWPFRGRWKQSQASEAYSLARLGLNGFRLLPHEPAEYLTPTG